MTNRLISTAFLLAVVVSSSLSSAKPMLSVSVRSMKTSYSIKENISLEIQLENVGTKPLVLYRNWGWGVGRTDDIVLDSNGKEVNTTFLADEIPPLPEDKDFMELKPNEFFGIRLSESATHFVNTPGTYDFLVEYTNIVSEEWAHENAKLPPTVAVVAGAGHNRVRQS